MRAARVIVTGTALVCLAACGGAATPTAQRPPSATPAASCARTDVFVAVTHGSGATRRACVALKGASSVTGEEALARSGLDADTAPRTYGVAVCRLDGEPAQSPPGCITPGGSYWSVWTANAGGAWRFSTVTIEKMTLGPGDSLGLRYQSQTAGPAPPATTPAPEERTGGR